MKTNKTAIRIAFALAFGATATTAHAANLVNGDQLTINAGVISYDANFNSEVTGGSWFAMDYNADYKITGYEKTAISQGTQGIVIGVVTLPGASHGGFTMPGDTNAIDAPWNFFGNTGSHYNNVAITGGTTGGLNMSGWNVTWNGIPSIPMGSGAWTLLNCATAGVVNCAFSSGVANFTWDGIYGHGYTLDYAATVPPGDASGFGDVHYLLHLEGTVQAVPVPAAVWLFGSGLAGLLGLARRQRRTT